MIGQPKVQNAVQTLGERISHDDVLRCIRCGLCSYTCPTYRVEECESLGPRGRLALVRAVIEGKLDLSSRFAEKFYNCVLCAACTSACPSGTKSDAMMREVRGILYEAGLVPEPIAGLLARLEAQHNISGEDNAGRLMWCSNMEKPPNGLGRRQAEMVYFVGCVSSLFPMSFSISQAFSQTLDLAGVDYTLLGKEEWCCGYPAYISGDVELARAMAVHNVEAFRRAGARQVVVSCPSCYHVFTHIYPELLGEEALAGLKVLHATELLADLLGNGVLKPAEQSLRVTYHDPCDLGRKSKLFLPPRRVLGAVPGVELVEMASTGENSLCCGGGGNVESSAPNLVESMAARRLAEAQDTGAELIVTACQQCKRTLTSAARKRRVRMRTVDVVELVWQALSSEG
ncbi:MAG: (Fe-S)-binding protein [Anaerolineae bacterium]